MEAQLTAEQQRMATAWNDGQGAWQQLQAEHAELRAELAQRRLDAAAAQEGAVSEVAQVGAQLQAQHVT